MRETVAADLGALASLMSELGYPVTPAALASRLEKMPAAHRTFVAELEGVVAGFVGCSTLKIYEGAACGFKHTGSRGLSATKSMLLSRMTDPP